MVLGDIGLEEQVKRTCEMPSLDQFTWMQRFRMDREFAAFIGLFTISGNATAEFDTDYIWVGTDNDGHTLVIDVWTDPDDDYHTSGPTLVANVEYTVAYVKDGDAHKLYLWDGAGPNSFTEIYSFTNNRSFVPRSLWIEMNGILSKGLNRIWTTALTPTQLLEEHTRLFPKLTTGLYGSWPMQSPSTVLLDWAGSRHWSFVGMDASDLDQSSDPSMAGTRLPLILRTDIGDDDNGEAYHAVLRSKPYAPATILHNFGVRTGAVVGKAASCATVDITLVRDFGAEETDPLSVNFAPSGNQTRVVKRLDNLRLSEMATLEIKIADPDTPGVRWELDLIALEQRAEARS